MCVYMHLCIYTLLHIHVCVTIIIEEEVMNLDMGGVGRGRKDRNDVNTQV